MEEAKELLKNKIKRYSTWAVILLIVGIITAVFAPAESHQFMLDLTKDVIQNLILGV